MSSLMMKWMLGDFCIHFNLNNGLVSVKEIIDIDGDKEVEYWKEIEKISLTKMSRSCNTNVTKDN
jgi:hypothetical protein